MSLSEENTKMKEEYILARIEEVRNYAGIEINTAKEIPNENLRMVCLFSILDAFAQAHAGYPTNNITETFTKFVLRFHENENWAFLDQTDPITFIYDVCRDYPDLKDLLDDNFTGGGGSILRLPYLVKSEKTEEIFARLKKNGMIEDKLNSYRTKHRYVNLLYKLRSKLTHELSHPGSSFDARLGEKEPTPFFVSNSVYDNFNDPNVPPKDEYWMLNVPIGFIEQLVESCVNNYLDYCAEEHIDPFEKNTSDRKCKKAWYD